MLIFVNGKRYKIKYEKGEEIKCVPINSNLN
jgi:hypothetical protein